MEKTAEEQARLEAKQRTHHGSYDDSNSPTNGARQAGRGSALSKRRSLAQQIDLHSDTR